MNACRTSPHEHRCADVHVALVPGERRIVGYRVVNDASRPVHVTPTLGPVHDLSSDASVPSMPWSIAPAGAFDVAPGAEHELRLTIETAGLLAGHVYRTKLVLGGTTIEPVSLVAVVEPAKPIVGRHDCSRLRAWLKRCCFGDDVAAIWAPGQQPHACCDGRGGHGHPTIH